MPPGITTPPATLSAATRGSAKFRCNACAIFSDCPPCCLVLQQGIKNKTRGFFFGGLTIWHKSLHFIFGFELIIFVVGGAADVGAATGRLGGRL